MLCKNCKTEPVVGVVKGAVCKFCHKSTAVDLWSIDWHLNAMCWGCSYKKSLCRRCGEAIAITTKRTQTMKTYEMVALANSNGKTYKTGDMFYNKREGFRDAPGRPWNVSAYGHEENGLNIFMHEDGWEEIKPRTYTMQELYKIVGHEFVLTP